ncbi:MAG: hypothetical protein WA849_08780 [Candidatus Udaeobacter sp.]
MSDLLPHSRPPARRRRGLWILLGLVVTALVIVIAGFFFARRQIGEFFAVKLGERLAEDGVFIAWKSADWVPGGGVRLHGLAVYRDPARHDRLAVLGLVTARRPEPSFLRWDKMNFKAADTQLLLGSGAGETRLEHMDMLLLVQPRKADLLECHASLQGLRIEAKCAFVALAHAGNADAVAAARQVVQREGLFRDVNLDWLKSVKEGLKFQPEKDEPVLRMELYSLPDDRGMESTMTFDGAKFQWRGQRWDFMQAAVKIPVGKKNSNSPIEIDHVRIGHAGRKAEIAGAFDPASRVIRISKFDSGIDLLALARDMMPDAVGSLSAVSTSGAWRVSGAGEIPMDHPENFRWNGDAALDGELVYARGQTNIAFQKPTFSVRVEEQVVTISDLKTGLWDGSLDVARLQVHLPSKEKKLRFETQLTLEGVRSQSIINIFGEARNRPGVVPLDWKGAWQISGTGEIPMDQPENFRWNGDTALDGDLVYASGQTNIALQKPTFSMRVEEQAVTISDLKAGLWDGSLDVARIQVHLPSKEKKLRIETQLTLDGARPQSIINSFSEAWKQPAVVPLNWMGAWRISGTAEIPTDQPQNFRWNGDAALGGELVYASGQTSIALQKPTFSMRVEEQAVTISDLKAGLWDGSLGVARLQVRLPSKEKKLRIETQLTLNSTRSSSVRKSFSAGQKQPRVVRLNWNGAGRVSAAGEIPVDHPENFRWHGEMALDGDLFYASGKTKVALQRPTFSVRVEKQVVSISNFKAGLWEGSFIAPKTLVYLPSEKKKARFETQFAIKDARLQSIINSFGGAQTEPGVVQCDWQGGGEFDLASLAGSGALSIGKADFGRVPIVGPLHFVFNILAPRFHTDEPSTMTVNHRMADSILYLEDVKLVSEHARIQAGGNIDLARESTQLNARGGLRKLPGLITVLFTSLLEFKGEGPVDNVRWSIKGFPGFHPIVNAPKKTTRTADAAEQEADRAVKGLIELPGKVLEDK